VRTVMIFRTEAVPHVSGIHTYDHSHHDHLDLVRLLRIRYPMCFSPSSAKFDGGGYICWLSMRAFDYNFLCPACMQEQDVAFVLQQGNSRLPAFPTRSKYPAHKMSYKTH